MLHLSCYILNIVSLVLCFVWFCWFFASYSSSFFPLPPLPCPFLSFWYFGFSSLPSICTACTIYLYWFWFSCLLFGGWGLLGLSPFFLFWWLSCASSFLFLSSFFPLFFFSSFSRRLVLHFFFFLVGISGIWSLRAWIATIQELGNETGWTKNKIWYIHTTWFCGTISIVPKECAILCTSSSRLEKMEYSWVIYELCRTQVKYSRPRISSCISKKHTKYIATYLYTMQKRPLEKPTA